MSSEVAKALHGIQLRIAEAAKKAGVKRMPQLVAVSKTKPVEMLQACYDAGQRHFGENYVQEVVAKHPELPKDIRWHFIGPLQSNKVKVLLKTPNLYMVETVHSEKIAGLLNRHAEGRAEPLKVLVQVNTSGETNKSGVEPSGCVDLVRYVVDQCKSLQFAGLMTIGSDCFECLLDCKQKVTSSEVLKGKTPAEEDFEVSMGMSGDFELAVSLGSTSVRVGSSIFGARQKKAALAPSATSASSASAEEKTEEKSAEAASASEASNKAEETQADKK